MRKFLMMLAILVGVGICNVCNAQMIKTSELEQYVVKNYGDKWTDIAKNIKDNIKFDKNDCISFTEIIPIEGKTKEEIYISLNYWFTATFNDANSVIKMNDKELGTIIAEGRLNSIATHTAFFEYLTVNIIPIIKCDIKDNKVRVTFTIPCYEVIANCSGSPRTEHWVVNQYYPFVKKSSYKRTASKAIVMSYAYSNIILDKLNECITHGLNNEDENW